MTIKLKLKSAVFLGGLNRSTQHLRYSSLLGPLSPRAGGYW